MHFSTRNRLLAGAALGLGLAVFAPAQAQAACVANPAASPVTGTVVCGPTTTADTTYPVNALTGTDREYLVNTSAGNVTGTINAGAVVDGFGLAFTNTVGGTGDLIVVNNGTVQVNALNTPTAGGSAALDITAIGATDVDYSGAGDIFYLGTGDGLVINTSGTGNISAAVGGSVLVGAGGDAIDIDNSGTAGNITVTTTAGEVIRAGVNGVAVDITNAANAGTINVTNNATIGSPLAAPGTINDGIDVNTSGTGSVTVANNGAIGSLTDRVTSGGIEAEILNATSTAPLTITGSGAIFSSSNGIVAGNSGLGTTTVNYTGAVNSTGALGIDVNVAAGNATQTTVTTGAGAVTATGVGGIGVSVTAGTGPTTVTTGAGAVTGADYGVQVASTGTQAITANGVVTGTGIAGIHSDTTAARTITVGTAGNVTGGTQAILLTNTGTATVGNSGTIGATASPGALAINAAAAGATTVNNNAGGTINGRLTLTANADTFANQGTFRTQGITDFGLGADTFTNTGTMTLTGATTLANLETFNQSGTLNLDTFVLTGPAIAFTNSGTIDTNGNAGLAGFTTFNNAATLNLGPGIFTVPVATFTNSGTILADEGASTITGQTSLANTGTIDLQDGVPDDTLTINSSFVGSGGSSLLVDYLAGDSDTLVINGAASGTTTVGAAYLGGGLDFDGSLVVDAASATTNAFVLGAVTGETPLVDVQLVQEGSDFFLVALPTEAAFNPLVVPGFAADIWYQSADEVFAETVKPATTEGISFWGNGYVSRDTRGDDSDFDFDVDVDDLDLDFDLDGSQKTKRHGLQMGVDYGFGGGRVGLTGGYGWAKANGDGDADVKAKGWNLGVYGQFGGVTGFHGEFLAKHDRYDGEFDDGVFDGEEFDIRATGVDGSLGYRFGFGGDGNIDVLAGLSHVRTKIDDISAFGFNYDMGKVTSTRGRAGVRAVFGGSLAPFVAGTVYREFDGDGDIDLNDGDEIFGIDTDGKATWVRLEAGLSGNDGPGPILAAWGDLGDRKGLGLRAGWRFGGRVAEAAPPPPAPVYVAPPAPPPPATQTCPDGSVILATDACPPPPPPPPPAPEPERG